jgi:hypothetical protein
LLLLGRRNDPHIRWRRRRRGSLFLAGHPNGRFTTSAGPLQARETASLPTA